MPTLRRDPMEGQAARIQERAIPIPRGYVLAVGISVALSLAIVPTRGNYRADAITFLFVALALAATTLVQLAREVPRPATFGESRVVLGLFVTLAGFCVLRAVDQKLLANAEGSWWSLRVLVGLEAALLATYLRRDPGAAVRPGWPDVRFASFAALTFLAGVETIRLVPVPPIDVWDVQMEGARALLLGQNPFEVVHVHDTAPGSTRTDIPYVYPPLQIFLTLPAVLLGDARYTMVVATVVIGVAFRTITLASGVRRHPLIEDAPALLVWFAPKLFHILEQAWIDPVQVALIAVAFALAWRNKRMMAAVTLGLVLASKQSMFWVFPIMAVAFRMRLRELAIAAAIPVAIMAPFAFWNFAALKFANLDIQVSLAPRPDALSFVVWGKRALGVSIPPALGFVFAAAVVALGVGRRREPMFSGILLSLTYFFFFAFNKWAFANYYFLIGSAAALGAACYSGTGPDRSLKDISAPP